MTNHQNGPPHLEVGPRPGHHPRTEDADTTYKTRRPHQEAGQGNSNGSDCRCAYGEPCVCDFYADWTCDWESPPDTPAQLRRRNVAALRSTPQPHSGRRDPISRRLGRWAA
jgi:hypothetical protein